MGAGCKPAGFCLRWFESNTLHGYYGVRAPQPANNQSAFCLAGDLTRRVSSGPVSGLWVTRPANRRVRRRMSNRMQRTFRSQVSAGVAQLVERQPSKLNVASSSLVSRSVFLVRGRPNPRTGCAIRLIQARRGCPNPRTMPSLAGSGRPNPRTGSAIRSIQADRQAAEPARRQTQQHHILSITPKQAPFESSSQMRRVSREPERSVRRTRAPEAQGDQADGRDLEGSPPQVSTFRSNAHLAQLVEHVLGKDEVTSSILVVGSKKTKKPLWRVSPGFRSRMSAGPARGMSLLRGAVTSSIHD
jgi:hypothetical protein